MVGSPRSKDGVFVVPVAETVRLGPSSGWELAVARPQWQVAVEVLVESRLQLAEGASSFW